MPGYGAVGAAGLEQREERSPSGGAGICDPPTTVGMASRADANPKCSKLNSFSPGLIARCGDENGPTHAGPEEVGHVWTVGTPSI